MGIIGNNKIILSCGFVAALVLCVGLFAVFEVRKAAHSTFDSYDTTAWKFGDLVQGDALYPVVRDIDGDTIVANVGGHEVTVRLIGADTPETVDPRKSVQCYGPEASAEAKRIFGEKSPGATSTGVFVYLDKDPAKGDYDKYGRLLAYVRLPRDIVMADTTSADTDLYNEYMIVRGFAREYTYLNQPYKFQAQFKADELAAKKARLGLWGNCPAGGD